MIDSLDKQILEIINKSRSIVRSVTEREIEHGVLYPSVSAMDIKRILSDYSINIIEGRLRTLEREGYIYYAEDRWWLTTKGTTIIGISEEDSALRESGTKPMQNILEETFLKFEPSQEQPLSTSQRKYNELIHKRKVAANLLSALTQGFESELISDEDYSKIVKVLEAQVNNLNLQIKRLVQRKS